MAKVDVKVVLLGQQSVGKTSLVDCYVNNHYEGQHKSTIGAAFAAKKVRVSPDRVISMGLWDTAGAERFESMSRMYYHGSKAAVICFDARSPASFEKAKFWVKELMECEPTCRPFLAVTKYDLVDPDTADGSANGQQQSSTGSKAPAVLPQEMIDAYAASIGAKVFRTSAKARTGVQELFNTIAEELAAALEEPPLEEPARTTPRALLRISSRLLQNRNTAMMQLPETPRPRRNFGCC